MSWFKVDDGFWSHPKVLMMSTAATSLWVRAGAYSCQHLTDGFIAESLLQVLGSHDAARELVESGLWLDDEGGYAFHDWGEYQETSEEVKLRREQARERQRKRRAQRDNNGTVTQPVTRDTKGDSRGSSHLVSTPDPTRPDPTSVPKGTEGEARKRAARIPEDFMPSDSVRGDMASKHPGVDLKAETEKFRDYWSAKSGKDAAKLDWDATWRNWIRRSADFAPKGSTKRDNTIDAWGTPTGQTSTDFIDGEVVEFRRALP